MGATPRPQRARTIPAAVSGSGLLSDGKSGAGSRKRSDIQLWKRTASRPTLSAMSLWRARSLLRARKDTFSAESRSISDAVKKETGKRRAAARLSTTWGDGTCQILIIPKTLGGDAD